MGEDVEGGNEGRRWKVKKEDGGWRKEMEGGCAGRGWREIEYTRTNRSRRFGLG